MKRFLVGALAAAGLLSISAPVLAATAYPIGTVNVRTGPGTQNAIVTTLSAGQTAQVLEHVGQWLKVATSSGTVGYMADWVTREVFDDQVAYLKTTDVLNVRTQPDALAPSLGQVQAGQQLRMLEGLAGWYKVDAGALGTGWVKGEYTYRTVTPTATVSPTPQAPLNTELPRAVLTKDVQAVRSTALYNGRSSEYDTIAGVRAWEHFAYMDSAEGWMKVANASGQRGWINGAEVLLTDKGVDFARQAIYTAREGDWSAKFLKVREVVPGGGGLALRSAPSSTGALIRSLPEGARFKLLQIPAGEYVEAMLPDGQTGWLSRNWIKPVAGMPEGESARIEQTSPGVLRLEVTGQLGAVAAGTDTLTVLLPENPNRRAALEVAQFGVAEFSLDQAGLTVRFETPFRYQVVANTGTRLLVEVRPVIEQVQAISAPDREIYRMSVAGTVEPSVRRDGDAVVVSLPGARLDQGVTIPPGLTVTADAAGVTFRAVSSRAFAIKRGAGRYDLELLAPGLIGKTIVVDPGHGGIESGAIGLSGLTEKAANLGIALKLKTLLEAAGAKVVMTRTTDVRCATPEELSRFATADEKLRYDLGCRSTTANTVGADAFLSIHNNASPDRTMRGTETYWSDENLNAPRSQAFATLVQEELIGALGLRNLGVKRDIFYVTKFTDAPAVLAEVAFLSNSTEDSLLQQEAFRQKTAEALFRALARLWN
ncbi:MAG TPA: N-acetylmuramoyl-L-alanine amidase [Symbiobacteriaceae bacterium]|nr:N-acetylmuramoyl-L-alanine amidase [Symbiobacteriaceae bacterium]